MAIVLGIDPGSRITGYGLIESSSGKLKYVASGRIKVPEKKDLAERLGLIYDGISEIVHKYNPTEFAVEKIFVSKSAPSALKLGQARGAAIIAGSRQGAILSEYEARKIKQAVVGTGAATKKQVQLMVKSLLALSELPKEDAADALGIAICHIHTHFSLGFISGKEKTLGFSRGRYSQKVEKA
jgi:crossover junction endodeoxyribonuclease RuvC